MVLLRTKGVQAKDNLLFCWCWDLTDFFWRILLGIQNNLISLWYSFALSADKTPACTGWLQCWVLLPSHWGPPPGPQQAVNSLVNVWNEQPSEVLHYRLPRGWFALSFLINWTLLTNNILICLRNFPRLRSFHWSCLKYHQTVWHKSGGKLCLIAAHMEGLAANSLHSDA